MKIKKLTPSSLLPVVADVITSSSKSKLYFNVKHGGNGFDLSTYTIGVDKKIFKPKGTEDFLELTEDNYVLFPVYKDKVRMKDANDNFLYYISKDRMEDHKNDYIILWEIPNKFYTDVKYKMSGNVRLLGTGTIGRTRGESNFTSPSPVIEVYGNCKMEWSAIDEDGNSINQHITFNNNDWNIGRVHVDKKKIKEIDGPLIKQVIALLGDDTEDIRKHV